MSIDDIVSELIYYGLQNTSGREYDFYKALEEGDTDKANKAYERMSYDAQLRAKRAYDIILLSNS